MTPANGAMPPDFPLDAAQRADCYLDLDAVIAPLLQSSSGWVRLYADPYNTFFAFFEQVDPATYGGLSRSASKALGAAMNLLLAPPYSGDPGLEAQHPDGLICLSLENESDTRRIGIQLCYHLTDPAPELNFIVVRRYISELVGLFSGHELIGIIVREAIRLHTLP